MLNSLILMAGFFASAMTPSELADANKKCDEMGGFLDARKAGRYDDGPNYDALCYLPNNSVIYFASKADEEKRRVKSQIRDCSLVSATRQLDPKDPTKYICVPKRPHRYLDQLIKKD